MIEKSKVLAYFHCTSSIFGVNAGVREASYLDLNAAMALV